MVATDEPLTHKESAIAMFMALAGGPVSAGWVEKTAKVESGYFPTAMKSLEKKGYKFIERRYVSHGEEPSILYEMIASPNGFVSKDKAERPPRTPVVVRQAEAPKIDDVPLEKRTCSVCGLGGWFWDEVWVWKHGERVIFGYTCPTALGGCGSGQPLRETQKRAIAA
jgi:hypothetical protein